MDIKVSRNYVTCQKAVSNTKHTEESLSAPVQAAGKARGDAIHINSEDVKMNGAPSFSAVLSGSMEEGAPADRIAATKQQVQEETYQMPAEQITRRLTSGLQERKMLEEIIDFLGEYAETLEAMKQEQIEELGPLMTRELGKIEQTIMIQKAVDKRLEDMEQGRRKLFVSYRIEGRTLKQIAEDTDPEQRKELMDLYRRINGAIGNIRYYNQKVEALAKSELEQIGIGPRYVGNPTGIYGYSVFSKGNKPGKKA